MAKNADISDGTLPTRVGKKTIVERTVSNVNKRHKVIGNIQESKTTKVIKRPRVIAGIKDVKPVKLRSNDKRKRYLNPKTSNMVLWKSLLAFKRKEMSALSAMKQKGNEEWQQKLKAFKEISQKNRKKDQ